MTGIGELSVSVTARTQKAITNIRNFRKTMNTLPAVIGRASTSIAGIGAAVAGIAGVASIGNQIRKSFSNIDELAKTSDKLGIATEKLSALRFAAEENGVAVTTTDMALQRMVRRIAEASRGAGEAVNALDEMNLSAERLAALSPDQQFSEIADAMSNVSNQGDRVRLAMKLFDSEGVSLVNTLRLGSEGLARYEKEAERLGITVSRFDASQVEKANDAFGRIEKVVTGISNKMAIKLAPIIEAVSDKFTDMGVKARESSAGIDVSLRSIAAGVGFVRDGIDFWIRSFKSVRAYVTEFYAWYLRTSQKVNQKVIQIINASMTPLVDTLKFITMNAVEIPTPQFKQSEFLKVFAEEMEGAAVKTRKAADEAWAKPLPSAGIEKWFSDLDANIEKRRKDFESMTNQQPAKGKMGLRLGEEIKSLSSLPGKLVESLTQGIVRLDRENPGILNANTAEGFAQLRRSVNSKGIQEKMLMEQRKETTATQAVVAAIDKLASTFMPPETVGFDS